MGVGLGARDPRSIRMGVVPLSAIIMFPFTSVSSIALDFGEGREDKTYQVLYPDEHTP